MERQGADLLGPKALNYQFLMLVRDKKYPEALLLGKKILETDPNNPSIKKFCDFILKNNTELAKLVQQQKQEEEYESVDSDDDEEGEQGEEEAQQDPAKEGDQQESSSGDEDDDKEEEEQQEQQEEQKPKQEPMQEEKPNKKVQLTTCSLNQFPHICTRDHN